MQMYRTALDSPVGELTLYSDGQAITAITMPVWRYIPPDGSMEKHDLPVFLQAKEWLENYFTGMESQDIPPISANGTPFQRQVWDLLREIPFGHTASYGEIARKLEAQTGRRTSARAVGNAVGRNPAAILIPCHRVIGSDGSLTGFGGGMDTKRFLLRLEGIPFREP